MKQPSKQANSIQQQYKSSTHDPSSFSNLTCTGTPLDCKTLPGCNAIFNECCYELSQSEQPYCCCFDPIVFDWEPVDGFYFPRCNLQYPYELGGGVCCDTVSPDVFAECIYVGNTVTLTPEPSLSPSKSSGFVSKSSKVSSLPSMTPTASPLFSYNPCPNGYTLDTTYFACCRDYYQFVPCDVQAQYYGDYCIQITKSTETQFTYLSDNPVQATFKGSCPKGTYTLENFSGCCKQGSIYDSLTDSCIYNLNCKNNNITLLLIPGVLSVATRTVSPTPSVPLSNSPSPSRLQYTICEAGRYTNAENYFQCCPVGYYFDLCRKICSSETGSLTQKTSYATALYGCPGGTNRPQALNYCCPTGTTLVSVEGFYFCRFFDVVCNFQEILLNPVLLEGGRYTATLAPTPNYSFEHCKPGSSMDRDWFVCCPDGYSFDHCSFGRDFCTESNGYLVNVLPMEEAYYYNECPQGTYLTADKNYCCKNGCTYNNEPSFPACICKINCTIGTNTFEDITVPLAINLIVRQSVTVSITPTVSALPSASKYIQNCPAGYGLNDTWYQCCPTGSQFDMCENTECISPTQRSFPLAMIYEGTSCPVGTLISLVGTKAFCCPYNSTLDYSTSVSTCIVDPDWYNENCGFYDEPKINVITLTNYQASATRSPIVTTTRTQTPSISASPLPKVNCREGFVLDPVWDLCCEIGFTYDPCLEYCVSDYFNKYSTIVSISLPEHAYFFQCPPGSQSYPVQDRCCGLFGTLVAFDVCEIDYQCSGKYGPVRYPSVIILSTTSVTPTKSPSASISYSPKCPANTYYSEKAQGCCPLGTVYDAYFGCCYNKINGDCPNVIPITNPTTSVSTSLSKSPSITRSNSRTPKASLTSFTTTPSLSSTISLSISVSMTPLPTPLCQKPNTNSLKSIVQQLSLSSSSLSSPLEFFNNGSFSLSVFSSDKHFLINEGISQQELEALGGFFLLNYGNWCGPGHGGFQDCCDGERCPACNENGILTPECILECPPVDALDNICVYHDSCTIQNPDDNPYGNTCGVVYPENYCACDCFFIQQLIQGIEFDICVTASSPLYCNTYMNAALYLFKNGYVKCYYYFEGYRDEPVCQPTDANGCYDPCEPNGSWSPDG